MKITQRITPCLWFDNQAEEAVAFYTSVFGSSRVVDVQRYSEAGPGEPGSVMVIAFELAGLRLTALNGGPHERFNDAISLQVDCATQEEIDDLWERLTADGGQEVQCGWLKDKYGVSWQIVPAQLQELLGSGDAESAARVSRALFGMKKLDIKALQEAAGRA
jgi:predicted 3-demethylubiquinone-9 3-methyltransferase (glyoxalase superfamily)